MNMASRAMALMCLAAFLAAGAGTAQGATTTISGVADIKGIRDNVLRGRGLVVGLAGTGDKSTAARKAIQKWLQSLNMELPLTEINSKNVAMVTLTATLPPFAREGQRIDVTVSSLFDATSLKNGVLLPTPLVAGGDEVYARAEGALSLSGGVPAAHSTVASLPEGAIVEKDVPVDFIDAKDFSFDLVLRNSNFTTASNIARTLDGAFSNIGPYKTKERIAMAYNAGLVRVWIPQQAQADPVGFISTVMDELPVDVEPQSVVVLNERSGAISMSDKVRLSPGGVAYEGLSVMIGPAQDKSENVRVLEINDGVTLKDVVDQLNRVKIPTRDLMAILQAMKDAGMLHARVEVK